VPCRAGYFSSAEGSSSCASCDEADFDFDENSAQAFNCSACGAGMYRWTNPRVYQAAVSWYEAKQSCEDEGGMLLTIDSAPKNSYLLNLIGSMSGFTAESVWIGYSQWVLTTDYRWTWVSGSQSDYTNWDSNVPNYYGTARCAAFAVSERMSDNYVVLRGSWTDSDCLN
jgi:hypothetical protein